MVWVRRWCLLAAALLAGCSRSAIVTPPAPGLDRSAVVARARAALRRPGQVVEVVSSISGLPASAVYVAADGRVVSTMNGHPEASWLPYLAVLTDMDRFHATQTRAGSASTGVAATGRYHTGDSNACRTNETIELDPGHLPVRWSTESCDGTKVSQTFTVRILEAESLPADLFG